MYQQLELDLNKKRREIRNKLLSRHYKLMPEVIINKLFRNQIFNHYYLILLILLLGIALIGFGVSNYWEGIPQSQLNFKPFQIRMVKSAVFISASFIYVVLLLDTFYVKQLLKFSCEYLLNCIESINDLEDFDNWLNATFNFKLQFFWSILFSVFIHVVWLVFGKKPVEVFGYGILISYFILDIFYGVTFYLFFQFLGFVNFHLNQYEIKLDLIDPGNSKIIHQLSKNLNIGVYINALFSIILALLFYIYINNYIITEAKISNLMLTIWMIIIWSFTIAMFVSIYLCLKTIISKKKREALQKIRKKINSFCFQEEDNLDDIQKLEYIQKLIEHHDRIVNYYQNNDSRFINTQLVKNILATLPVFIPVFKLYMEFHAKKP